MRAMKKPNGHLNMWLYFKLYNPLKSYVQHYQQMKSVWDDKNNITALDLRLDRMDPEWVTFFLHENTRFKFLEKLALNKGSVNNLILENLLQKHAEQITHLKLESQHEELDNEQIPELPKLQTLELVNCLNKDYVKSLCLKSRQSLTCLSFEDCGLINNMEEVYFPQLKCLKLDFIQIDIISLSAHSGQLETLKLECFVGDLPDSLPKLKHLWLADCRHIAPNVLMQSTPALRCLVLEGKLPALSLKRGKSKSFNLTDLYLLDSKVTENKGDLLRERATLIAKNADTLEFLVLKFKYNRKSFQRIKVKLERVHTVIIYDENPLASDREILKAVCPNAQIMTTNNKREYAISIEAIKSRLKYIRADPLFFNDLYLLITAIIDLPNGLTLYAKIHQDLEKKRKLSASD